MLQELHNLQYELKISELQEKIKLLESRNKSLQTIVDNLLTPAKGKTVASNQAQKVIKVSAKSLRGKILLAIWKTPSTCSELENRLGLKHQTCSARISELLKAGLVSQGELRDGGHVLSVTGLGSDQVNYLLEVE